MAPLELKLKPAQRPVQAPASPGLPRGAIAAPGSWKPRVRSRGQDTLPRQLCEGPSVAAVLPPTEEGELTLRKRKVSEVYKNTNCLCSGGLWKCSSAVRAARSPFLCISVTETCFRRDVDWLAVPEQHSGLSTSPGDAPSQNPAENAPRV